jgi:hypothetical protein
LTLSACPAFDEHPGGDVTVDELVTAVNDALSGCPAVSTTSPAPSATPTSTRPGSAMPTQTPDHNCTEDASAFVTVNVESIQVLDRQSPCTDIAPTLETRTASVMFTNTHPSRRIAIAAIIVYQSDKRSLPASPCELAIQEGAFGSLDDCHVNIAMGCNSPAGLFLDPGQTSGEFGYSCISEDLYPGNGSCGSMSLETTTGSVLAHAVFCDDFETAQANFCAIVHPGLLDTGMPVRGFTSISTSNCP